jgi:hypothetical protein
MFTPCQTADLISACHPEPKAKDLVFAFAVDVAFGSRPNEEQQKQQQNQTQGPSPPAAPSAQDDSAFVMSKVRLEYVMRTRTNEETVS